MRKLRLKGVHSQLTIWLGCKKSHRWTRPGDGNLHRSMATRLAIVDSRELFPPHLPVADLRDGIF